MFVAAASILLFISAISVSIIYRLKPGFRYYWLILSAISGLCWLMVLLQLLSMPSEQPLLFWEDISLIHVSPAIRIDQVSWSMALALAALPFAILLTSPARTVSPSPLVWAGILAIASAGLLAVTAGNPLTLLLAWVMIDITELFILVGQLPGSAERVRLSSAYLPKILSILLVLLAILEAQSSGVQLGLLDIPPSVNLYLFLAAALRLGVLPLHLPFLTELQLRRGLGIALRLVPAAASLSLLARTAVDGIPVEWQNLVLALAGLAGIYGGLSWLFAADELDGRPFWLLGITALSVASAALAQPEASLGWALIAVLSGAALFLASHSVPARRAILLAGLLAAVGLPYSPGWPAAGLFGGSFSMHFLWFALTQALLWAGYLRHSLTARDSLVSSQPYITILYQIGFIFPLLVFAGVGWSILPWMKTQVWWSGLLSLPAGTGLFLLYRRVQQPSSELLLALRRFFSLEWLYRMLWAIYNGLGRLVHLISIILEGEGGLLWTVLILILIAFILGGFQSTGGGFAP